MTTHGRIITPLHAISGPVPVTLVAYTAGDVFATLTRQEVRPFRVIRADTTYDLAELAVTGRRLPGFGWAHREPSQKTLPALVFANTMGPDGEIHRNHALKGTVTSFGATIAGTTYARLSIPFQPGCSGAALCNTQGGMIGIVTHRPDQPARAALAVQMADLDRRAHWVNPAMRKADPARARALAAKADQLFGQAGRDRDPQTLFWAQLYLRHALVADPGNVAILHAAGEKHLQLGRPDVAFYYFRKATRLDRQARASFAQLGLIQLDKGHADQALTSFRNALSEPTDPAAVAPAAEGFSRLMARQRNWPAAAYAWAWSGRGARSRPASAPQQDRLAELLARAAPSSAELIRSRARQGGSRSWSWTASPGSR